MAGKSLPKKGEVAARAILTGAQNSVKVNLYGITVLEKIITQDGQTIKITIVKPSNAKGLLPVFTFFHGGGWVLGDFPTHKRMIRDIVVESVAVAVYVVICHVLKHIILLL